VAASAGRPTAGTLKVVKVPDSVAHVIESALWSSAGLRSKRSGLSQPLSSFLGRDDVLQAIGERFASGDRLVTLLGPPGIGKTRAALRFAELEEARSERGVRFCDVTEAEEEADLVAAIARGLSLPPGSADLGYLLARSGPMLVVLDNAERAARGAGPPLKAILGSAPEIRMLVTSRERLSIEGESVIEVGPLSLPPVRASTADEIKRAESVLLFLERARAAMGEPIADEALEHVARLVNHLDGIPLAIELAAARSRVFEPRELLERLGERFDLLSKTVHAGTNRHGTLRAAIDWSWRSLTPTEQAVLAQCSVFAGGFDSAAAESIIESDRHTHEVLEALRDRSLLQRRGGSGRFHLYESIRDYARERRIELGLVEGTNARHREHYLALGRSLFARWIATGDRDARRTLSAERENLLAIHRREPDGPRRAECVLFLEPTMSAEGPFRELAAMLDRAVETPGVPPAILAKLLIARGNARGVEGRGNESAEDLERARAIGGAIRDRLIEIEALVMLCARRRVIGEPESAEEAGKRAIALIDPASHPRLLGNAHACLGLLCAELERFEEAREHDERARSMMRALGDRWSEALALGNLAQIEQEEGRWDRARQGYDETIAAFRGANDLRYEGIYLGHRASLEHEADDRPRARELYLAALERLRLTGADYLVGFFTASLAALEASSDDGRAARDLFASAAPLLDRASSASLRAALEIHRGHLDLLEARSAPSPDAPLARARRRLSEGARVRGSQAVRFAERLLERGIAALDSRRTAVMEIHPSGASFSVDGSPKVDLSRRGALRRLFGALVQRRIEAPGSAIDKYALLAEGWPGDKVQVEAGSTRVRVAIATLRRLGLGGVLVTRDDGYLIDPHTTVRIR
jgi:predicted ATPase